MSLSDEQKTELERRDWRVVYRNDMLDLDNRFGDSIHIDLSMSRTSTTAECAMRDLLTVAAVLGIAPPGYRLVKEEVFQDWVIDHIKARRILDHSALTGEDKPTTKEEDNRA